MFKMLASAICERIRRMVFETLSAEMDAADGCGALQVDVTPALPSPEKRRAGK